MWKALKDDLDFNCGDIVSDGKAMGDSAQSLLNLFVETANGKECKSEINKQTELALSFTSESL